ICSGPRRCSPRPCARSTTSASWCAWWTASATPCTPATSTPCGRRPPAATTAPRGERSATVSHERTAPERAGGIDRTTALGAAVTALVVALALTVPAVIATRVDPLADRAQVALEPLAEGDTVHSLPAAGSPVMVRRADGPAEVLIDGVAHRVDATAHDVLALSADGRRLVRATGASTEVLLLDPTASTPDGGFPARSFEGTPLALVGDTIVLRSCADGFCRLSGYDLTAPEEPS